MAKRVLSFAAFTAAFAALVAFVFWGTWSLDVAPVMPDDTIVHPMAYADYWAKSLRKFLTSGKFIPSDLLWDGLLVSPYFCQELKYAVALYCAGLGLAWFLRGRGLSPLASYGAGLLLSFCGYWASLFSAGHGGWFVWMTFGVFAFGLVDRAVRLGRLRHWLLLGACVAWASFYQADLWLLFTVFTGLYFVWCCVRERKFPWKGTLLAAVVFFAIGAPSFRQALVNDLAGRDKQIADGETISPEDAATGDADEKRWIFVTNWSLPPDEIAEFVVPRLNGDTSCPLTLSLARRAGKDTRPYTGALGRPKGAAHGNYRQHSLYVGWVTCLLALAGAVGAATFGLRVRFRKKTDAQERVPPVPRTGSALSSLQVYFQPPTQMDAAFFLVAAIVFLLFSFGRYCEPVYRLVYALPFGDYLRAPVKWHHLTEFCLCVLAGYGIDWLLTLKPLQNRVAVATLGAFVLFGAFDLARSDKIYCAPVDLRRVRQTNSEMQMSVLSRADFAKPEVAEAVRRGQVVSLANYLGHPDYFLVGVLTPRKPNREPLPPFTTATALGCLSLLASAAVLVLVLSDTVRRRLGALDGRGGGSV